MGPWFMIMKACRLGTRAQKNADGDIAEREFDAWEAPISRDGTKARYLRSKY